MKKIFLSLFVLCGAFEVFAQQQYFVFIQEAAGQPFYVRIKEESHSSSASGHIILPQLKDSVYQFFVGFPRGRIGEQLFVITIGRKDHGYELRNANGRYSLYDLQTQQTINPASTEAASDQTIRKTDTYSALMADVVDDTAVLYTSAQDTMSVDSNAVPEKMEPVVTVPVVAQNVPATQQTASTAQQPASDSLRVEVEAAKPAETDSAPVKVAATKAGTGDSARQKVAKPVTRDTAQRADTQKAPELLTSVDSSDVNNTNSPRDSRNIIRLSTENVRGGKLMIYVDRTGATSDTIRIVIPRRL